MVSSAPATPPRTEQDLTIETREEPSVIERGRHVGRFLVLGPLGRGGMGVVVEAHDEQLDRTVALKLLHHEATRRHHTRLLREAQALARLSHPNVVQIYDVGTIEGRMFIAMELVRGRTLTEWRREPHTWRATVEVYLQAARGLAAAHAKDLVHRDFKPDNCIIGNEGRVRVLDFGLAREVAPPSSTDAASATASATAPASDASAPTPSTRSGALSARVTREGAVVGTVAYMSCEQLLGQPADARSDQYSLCVSLYEALYGELPYPDTSPGSILYSMMVEERSTPAGHRVPRRLRRAILRGLSREPSDRWPSVDALVAELEAILRRRRWWSAGLMLGLGVTLGGGLAVARYQQAPCPEPDSTLAGAWDQGARQRVMEAFAQYGPEDSDTLQPRILDRLDDHAQRWATMTHESCVATFVDRRQSESMFELRARCLERRLSRFTSAVDALAEADSRASLIQRTILPFKLPGLAPCADLEALADPRAPESAPQDPRTWELRHRLDQADALRQSGQFEAALTVARAVRDEVAGQDDPRIHAEALERVGHIEVESSSADEGRRTLEDAILEASRADDDETAARAWISLIYALTVNNDLLKAHHRLIGATAAVERVDDDLLRAWLLNNRGVLYSESEKFDRARTYFEQALELKSRVLGEGHVDVGIAWLNLGLMLTHSGRHQSAREPIRRAMAIFEDTVGHSHPLTTYALGGLCNVELGRGNAQAAVDLCERAIDRFDQALVAPSWEGRLRFTLAKALHQLGDRDRAQAMAEQAARTIASEDPIRAETINAWIVEHAPSP